MELPLYQIIEQYGIYAVFALCTIEGDITLLLSGVLAHSGFFGKYSFIKVILFGTLGGMAGIYGSADGAGSAARFSNPNGVAVDSVGNLYVADFYLNTIRKGYPPPMFRNPGIIAGQFVSVLTGPPGQMVIVDASTDLVNWLPISTNTFTGPLNFNDPQSGLYSNRFYRAHLP